MTDAPTAEIASRAVLPPVPEDSTERQRTAQAAQGCLDELDLLRRALVRVGLHERAARIAVARAIVWKEMLEVIEHGA